MLRDKDHIEHFPFTKVPLPTFKETFSDSSIVSIWHESEGINNNNNNNNKKLIFPISADSTLSVQVMHDDTEVCVSLLHTLLC